jgi:hypothetical protein
MELADRGLRKANGTADALELPTAVVDALG